MQRTRSVNAFVQSSSPPSSSPTTASRSFSSDINSADIDLAWRGFHGGGGGIDGGSRGPGEEQSLVKESDPDESIEPLIGVEFVKLREAARRWRGAEGGKGGGGRTLVPAAFEKVLCSL